MKNKLFVLIIIAIGFISCKKDKESTHDSIDKPAKNIQNQNKSVYSRYNYTDSIGMKLIIENSFPKGGMRYIAPNGQEYNYAVFWTRLINETNNTLELNINFPVDSYEISSLPGKYFKIVMPPNIMTLEKIPLFNYGLTDLKTFLDNSIDKSSLKRTISSKESTGFYVVILCPIEGAKGTLRTSLSLKGQHLFYKINDKEIGCGSINLKNLKLQK